MSIQPLSSRNKSDYEFVSVDDDLSSIFNTMDDETDLGVGLSVTCSTSMDECYDVDVESTDEPSASTSSLSFGMDSFNLKGQSSPVSMFYPQISSYDIHPLLLNNRRSSDGEDDDIDNDEPLITDSDSVLVLPDHHLLMEPVRHKNKHKQKSAKRKNTSSTSSLFVSVNQSDEVDTSDYSNSKARKAFYCRACAKAFKFQTSLLRHNNKVHISKYQCPTCSRVFSRQAYLDVHTSKQGSSCFLGNYSKNHK
ncbi:uncharacterized protein [Bemisia tabaci]|uniref:uncharacterized protein isoform X2 n=1 Tax=Bemisia tabaci TaxID=7038 RepID=UPI0008F9DE70|nr:PREDICTED: zinc finger protein ZAT4-like isoform X2 [Bemisia tabaci]